MSLLEEKLEKIDNKLDALALLVEHRLTKLEVKAGIYGVVGGAIVTAVSAFVHYK